MEAGQRPDNRSSSNGEPTPSNIVLDYLPIITKVVVGILHSIYAFINLAFLTIYPVEKSLKDKVVLVTGAGRGLGREMSYLLAKEGAKVVCVDINAEGVKETADVINGGRTGADGEADFYTTNVAEPSQVNELAKAVEEKWGKVDVLINNAGIVASAPLMDTTDEQIKRMIDVNLVSHFWMVRAFLPAMKKRNEGHIVATSSVAAFTCAANIVPYAATKYGVTGLMASLREELRANPSNNIKTTTVHPFFLDSAPINVKHWDVKSALPIVSIPQVARAAIQGIKREDVVVTVPEILRLIMQILWIVPQKSADYWRDAFSSKINSA
ncbi:17-beta-hydroxysteroid dehydrogenase 13-like [Metopolophium dirhodum]|uniref:17-beta-hydroxysteroid dehydrogenase 13-like n=1 Tax=Metopolophium dirhodum TaxID=44670 RepID=UPI00298FB336|nr:17-beta-hydroxysteroid dehydrogenase 13-like [Metopolophium dirhodum]